MESSYFLKYHTVSKHTNHFLLRNVVVDDYDYTQPSLVRGWGSS